MEVGYFRREGSEQSYFSIVFLEPSLEDCFLKELRNLFPFGIYITHRKVNNFVVRFICFT